MNSVERDLWRKAEHYRAGQRSKITPESTLRAIRALEKGADEIMRVGDPHIAVELYSVALLLRMEANIREEETQNVAP